MAARTMAFLDRRLVDPHGRGGAWGGYHEHTTEGLMTIPLPRRQNPHMHLVEALLALHATTGDRAWLDRARPVVDLVLDGMIDPETGQLVEFFEADWRPAPGDAGRVREPGHHYEWVWLLLAWRAATGDDRVLEPAERLYRFALAGTDDGAEGPAAPFDAVDPAGRPTADTKRLWCQTEAIKAFARAGRAFGRRRCRGARAPASRRAVLQPHDARRGALARPPGARRHRGVGACAGGQLLSCRLRPGGGGAGARPRRRARRHRTAVPENRGGGGGSHRHAHHRRRRRHHGAFQRPRAQPARPSGHGGGAGCRPQPAGQLGRPAPADPLPLWRHVRLHRAGRPGLCRLGPALGGPGGEALSADRHPDSGHRGASLGRGGGGCPGRPGIEATDLVPEAVARRYPLLATEAWRGPSCCRPAACCWRAASSNCWRTGWRSGA